MKKTIFNCFFLLLLLAWQGCKDEKVPFTTLVEIKTEVKSNQMDMDETWENTKSFDLRKELKDRYGVDLDKNKLTLFKITGAEAEWSSANCRKLSDIKTEFSLPDIANILFESGGSDWDDQCNAAGANTSSFKFIEVNIGNDPFSIIGTDFSDAINRGEKIIVDYSLTAAEEIEAQAITLSFTLKIEAEFLPK